MIHWGINALNHGSSLAVFNYGKFIGNEINNTNDNPHDLISDALFRGWEPDRIFWYERPWVKKSRQVYAGQYKTAFRLDNLPSHHLKKWGISNIPVTYTPHHASHAASGYYTSPFDHCAVVVLDAIGEFECATIWEAKHGELKKVWSARYPHSLGLFYSAFTKLVGLEPIKQEHLFQQMSDNGDPDRFYNTAKEYTNGIVSLTRNLHRGVLDWPFEINNLQDQCDIAAAVQRVFEEQISLVMARAKLLTGSDSLVYMGGCAMNSKANQKLVEPMWKYIWSLPQPGDPSSSIGAVLYHTKQRLWKDWGQVKHIAINT